MKMLSLLLGVCFVIGLSAMAADAPAKKGKLRHVVAFKFKESASKADIKKVEDAFANLKNQIKTIVSYEHGLNNSPEKHNKGCTHAFILTFNSEKDRDGYLDAPAHQEFGKLVGPLLDDVFVIDFWAE